MDEVLNNNILAAAYLLVWIFTLVWYQAKERSADGGTAIICAYILYAIFSLISLNDSFFSLAYDPLTVFPYIYLYVMMMIAMSPLIYNHINPTSVIVEPETKILSITSWLIIICSILILPNIIQNSGDGIVKLFTDTDAGNDAYMEQASNADESGSGINNLSAIIYNSLSDITVFLCFYYMTLKRKNIVLIVGLFFAILVGLLMPIMNGERSGVALSLLTVIGGYMLFRRYLSKRINRLVQITGIVLVIVISLPIAAITVSRFGEKASGVGGYLTWYIGQGSLYFNNKALDAGGTRNGDRTMNLLKRVIDPSTPKNYSERRDKYHNLKIDDYNFTTFVGDFVIDFGPVVPIFIFIGFNTYVILKIRPDNEKIKVHQLLLLFFTLCISMQGGMYLFSFSDTGNLRIVTLFGLYGYLRYHEVLLEKFPLKTDE